MRRVDFRLGNPGKRLPGHGNRLKFDLLQPHVGEHEGSDPLDLKHTSSFKDLRAMQNPRTILVIEDDPDFRNLLKIHLSLAGFRLELAEDGIAGGKALLEHRPDLVLSDINMPNLNGFELLSRIRSDEKTASIPVILLSGQSDAATAAEAVKLGAADFLVKPISVDVLLASIRYCLARADRRAAAHARSG